MKFLIRAKPIYNVTQPENLLEAIHQARELLAAWMVVGVIDCAYGDINGGGCCLANMDTAEELYARLTAYPFYRAMEWQVEPVYDMLWVLDQRIQSLEMAAV